MQFTSVYMVCLQPPVPLLQVMQRLQQTTLSAAFNGWLDAMAIKRSAFQQAQQLAAVAVHRMQNDLLAQAFAVSATTPKRAWCLCGTHFL